MKNYIDEKVTVWKRYHFSDDADMEKLVDQMKANEDVYDILEVECGFATTETLDETETFMTAKENEGQATIEAYRDDKEIWNNAVIKDEPRTTKLCFLDRLNDLTKTAIVQIELLLQANQQIILFEATSENDEEWTKDIYNEIPDVPFYRNHSDVEYAAIRKVAINDETIVITAVLKGDSYPDEVALVIGEIDSSSILSLTDYLLS